MYGTVVGDIIASTNKWHNVKVQDFELFPFMAHHGTKSILENIKGDCNEKNR